MHPIVRASSAALLALASFPALAQPPQSAPPAAAAPAEAQARLNARAADLAAVMAGRVPADTVFAPVFLAQISPAQIKELADGIAAQFGPVEGVADVQPTGPTTATFRIRLARGTADARLSLDGGADHRVDGFLITAITPNDTSPDAITSRFSALPGRTGFTVTRLDRAGPREMLALNADQHFAIGSAFKLWVLDALAEEIAQGRRHWSDVVILSRRSLPSGQMQDWPQGSPVTLATLASLMISVSDNTATDQLIDTLGRDALARRVRATGHSAPSRMIPMLSTLEAFALKLAPAQQVDAYVNASDAAQIAMLIKLGTGLSAARIDTSQFAAQPRRINEIEWFASPRDVVGVMQSLVRRKDPMVLKILGINTGLSADQAGRFQRVGFKGGSEPGVLNLSWLVQTKAGTWYVVTQSWNDTAPGTVTTMPFVALGQQLLALVK